jgi:hypothetical protein
MKKYNLLGISSLAYKKLDFFDIQEIEKMIPCIVFKSKNVSKLDGAKMFVLPDGQDVRGDYIIIKPKISANQKRELIFNKMVKAIENSESKNYYSWWLRHDLNNQFTTTQINYYLKKYVDSGELFCKRYRHGVRYFL